VIVHPSAGQVITDRGQTDFEAEAWVGTTRINGNNIDRVDFIITGMGHTTTDYIVRYCAFSGDASCALIDQAKWNNLKNGSHVIKVRGCSAITGDCTGWVSKTFDIQK